MLALLLLATSAAAICINPSTGGAGCTTVRNVYDDKGYCYDPSGNVTPCLCPTDTCVAEFDQNGFCQSCHVIRGIGYTGGAWDAKSQSFFLCTQRYRDAVCNGHGDVPDGTAFTSAGAPKYTSGAATLCQCDCGFSDITANGVVHRCASQHFHSSESAAYEICKNPATSVVANFTIGFVANANTAWGRCYTGKTIDTEVPCYCPNDTCSLDPTTGRAVCLVVNGKGYTGNEWNTAIPNNHAYIMCGQTYRNAVCNGNGDVVAGTKTVSPDAQNTPCACDPTFSDLVFTDGRIQRCALQMS